MGKVKHVKISLDNFGSYLGMEKGCYIIKDKNGNTKRYAQFENEIGEVILKSGNTVSVGALASLSFWDIDVLIMTQRGRPVAMLKSIDSDSGVETRLSQLEAYKNSEKAIEIAKTFVYAKLEGQQQVLLKHGLQPHDLDRAKRMIDSILSDNLSSVRRQLIHIEGEHSKHYFQQIFQLFPEHLKPSTRKGFMAYDGTNNIFNLAYEILAWKIHKALIKANLEPYLGFLHYLIPERASLVCDFQELYRYLIDDFLISYCQRLRKRDFTVKTVKANKRHGKREFLNNVKTADLLRCLEYYFQFHVKIPRIRRGFKQELETLINEEAILFSCYLRNERKEWQPANSSCKPNPISLGIFIINIYEF